MIMVSGSKHSLLLIAPLISGVGSLSINKDGESEIRNIQKLEASLADVTLPFEDIVPEAAREWMERIAESHETSREMLLLSALTSTSALIGKNLTEGIFHIARKGFLTFEMVKSLVLNLYSAVQSRFPNSIAPNAVNSSSVLYPSFVAEIHCNPTVSRTALHSNLTSGTQIMVTQECLTQQFRESQQHLVST